MELIIALSITAVGICMIICIASTSNAHEKVNIEDGIIKINRFILTNLDSGFSVYRSRELWLGYTNNSDKPIKYLYYTVDFYNRVEEKIGSKTYAMMGPLYKGQSDNDHYYEIGPLEKSSLIVKAVITEMAVKYMDDTVVWIKNDDLKDILGPKVAYQSGHTQHDERTGEYKSPALIIFSIIAWGLFIVCSWAF